MANPAVKVPLTFEGTRVHEPQASLGQFATSEIQPDRARPSSPLCALSLTVTFARTCAPSIPSKGLLRRRSVFSILPRGISRLAKTSAQALSSKHTAGGGGAGKQTSQPEQATKLRISTREDDVLLKTFPTRIKIRKIKRLFFMPCPDWRMILPVAHPNTV